MLSCSSTCVNLLKLPEFSSPATLRSCVLASHLPLHISDAARPSTGSFYTPSTLAQASTFRSRSLLHAIICNLMHRTFYWEYCLRDCAAKAASPGLREGRGQEENGLANAESGLASARTSARSLHSDTATTCGNYVSGELRRGYWIASRYEEYYTGVGDLRVRTRISPKRRRASRSSSKAHLAEPLATDGRDLASVSSRDPPVPAKKVSATGLAWTRWKD